MMIKRKILLLAVALMGAVGMAQTDVLMGDVTGDGQVDISDVNAVINVMLGKSLTPSPSPGGEGSPADVNGDGQVDVSDVNAIINIMLGKASPLTISSE